MKRQSNFELLRILTIASIVMGHCLRQSGLIESATGTNHYLACFLGSFLRIGVNVFLLIGCWFMVDATFTWKRPLKLYLQTAFYTVPLTVLMLCIGETGSVRNVIQGFIPFFGRAVWFVSAYISLLMLSSYLQPILFIDRRRLEKLLVLLFILVSFVSTIPSSVQVDYMSDFLWFPYVYLLTGYVKRYQTLDRLPSGWICLLGGLLIYAALAAAKSLGLGGVLPENFLCNIRCIPNFACAFFVFAAFAKFDIGSSRLINALARPTLAVYVIHQTPAFIDFEWQKIFRCTEWTSLSPAQFLAATLAVPAALFAAAFLTESIRTILSRTIRRGEDKPNGT